MSNYHCSKMVKLASYSNNVVIGYSLVLRCTLSRRQDSNLRLAFALFLGKEVPNL